MVKMLEAKSKLSRLVEDVESGVSMSLEEFDASNDEVAKLFYGEVRLLLDTHIAIWAVSDQKRLGVHKPAFSSRLRRTTSTCQP